MTKQNIKKYYIPIFTEDYGVSVVFGDRDKVKKELAKYTGYADRSIDRDFTGRGICYNILPNKAPIIAIDGDLDLRIAIATMAHESIHAINYIREYIQITDDDEFVAHGTACIMRTILKDLINLK